MMKISLVIPFYNEEANVSLLIEEAFNALQSIDAIEIVAVDDASEDNTLATLLALKDDYPNLRVIQHPNNAGQSAAIVTGTRFAKYDWIATIDGDGQNPPGEINQLINAYQTAQQKTLYIGNRQQRNDSNVKLISSRIANKIRQFFLRDDCPDSGCGLKLFPKEMFLNAPFFNHCHRFMPALFRIIGKPVVNVPVAHRARHSGVSKYGTLDRTLAGIFDLFGVLWLRKRYLKQDKGEER